MHTRPLTVALHSLLAKHMYHRLLTPMRRCWSNAKVTEICEFSSLFSLAGVNKELLLTPVLIVIINLTEKIYYFLIYIGKYIGPKCLIDKTEYVFIRSKPQESYILTTVARVMRYL